jgi:hypothetical protein
MTKSRGNELEDSVSALYNLPIISYFAPKSKENERKILTRGSPPLPSGEIMDICLHPNPQTTPAMMSDRDVL